MEESVRNNESVRRKMSEKERERERPSKLVVGRLACDLSSLCAHQENGATQRGEHFCSKRHGNIIPLGFECVSKV
jgi:hypothetical protein